MQPHPRRHNDKILWGLVFLAIAFNAVAYFHPSLTGNDKLNGLLGVWLGLFISAWPAANYLNMILFEQVLQHWQEMKRSEVYWLLLNLALLLIGMATIIVGTKLFFRNWQ
jgi:hypothetical protein